MIERLKAEGHAHVDQGALVIDVKEETDTKEIPPCMILKSDGAALYATTDLATLIEREKLYHELQKIPDLQTFKPMGNFFLVKILKEGVTSFDVFDFLIRRKLFVRDCASFACLEGEYIRFCVLSPENNQRLLDGLKEFFQ